MSNQKEKVKVIKKDKHEKVERMLFKSYLKVINNSVGSKIFRNYYVRMNGKVIDAMQNGHLSCAFFVSSILLIFGLIKGFHGTVEGTVKDLEKNGWYKIKNPKKGSVLIWESVKDRKDNKMHKHIGFYMGNGRAISNYSKVGKPLLHHYTFNNTRKVETIYWNKIFDK